MKKEVMILLFLISIMQVSAVNQQGSIIVNIPEGDGGAIGDCKLDFKEGWNLFSFCSNLNNPNLIDVLSQIDGKYRYVMKWDSSSQSFDIYSPKATQKPFTVLDNNSSYFIYMFENASLDILGQDVINEERNLIEGWNTPAYQYKFSTLIDDIFKDVIDNFRFLMKWNTTNQEFAIYSKRSQVNPFNEIFKGEGRFIYMENPDTINK